MAAPEAAFLIRTPRGTGAPPPPAAAAAAAANDATSASHPARKKQRASRRPWSSAEATPAAPVKRCAATAWSKGRWILAARALRHVISAGAAEIAMRRIDQLPVIAAHVRSFGSPERSHLRFFHSAWRLSAEARTPTNRSWRGHSTAERSRRSGSQRLRQSPDQTRRAAVAGIRRAAGTNRSSSTLAAMSRKSGGPSFEALQSQPPSGSSVSWQQRPSSEWLLLQQGSQGLRQSGQQRIPSPRGSGVSLIQTGRHSRLHGTHDGAQHSDRQKLSQVQRGTGVSAKSRQLPQSDRQKSTPWPGRQNSPSSLHFSVLGTESSRHQGPQPGTVGSCGGTEA